LLDNASQPETKAIIENLIQKQVFSLSIALDGGSVLVTYPYDKPVQTGMQNVISHICYLVSLHLFKQVSNVSSKFFKW
jgi:hypothetical protein